MMRKWTLSFGSPLIGTALAIALACGAASPVRAEDGGMKDPSTGLVWSPPFSGRYTWTDASRLAEKYTVVEGGVTYDDWRIPTWEEMIAACEDGFLPTVFAAHFWAGNFWSSEQVSRSLAWYVEISYWGPDTWPWQPRFYSWYKFSAPKTTGLLVIFVRGPQPPPSSHHGAGF
jgi:hypothetical protein